MSLGHFALSRLPIEVQWCILKRQPRDLLPLYRLVSKDWKAVIDAYLAEVGWPCSFDFANSFWHSRTLFEQRNRRGQSYLAIDVIPIACRALVSPSDVVAMAAMANVPDLRVRCALQSTPLDPDWVLAVATLLSSPGTPVGLSQAWSLKRGVGYKQYRNAEQSPLAPLGTPVSRRYAIVEDDNLDALKAYIASGGTLSPSNEAVYAIKSLACRCLAWLLATSEARGIAVPRAAALVTVALYFMAVECIPVIVDWARTKKLPLETHGLHMHSRNPIRTWEQFWYLADNLPGFSARGLYSRGWLRDLWDLEPQPNVKILQRLLEEGVRVHWGRILRMPHPDREPVDSSVLCWLEEGGLATILGQQDACDACYKLVLAQAEQRLTDYPRRRYGRAGWMALQRIVNVFRTVAAATNCCRPRCESPPDC